MNKDNKSYCRVPFDSVTISPTGRMQLCCEAQWTGGNEHTKLKDIDSIQHWFRGKYLSQIRKDMLDGKQIAECEVCYKREKYHGISSRTEINKKYFADNTSITEQSIKKVDVKFGNKCNLKCKMCFPYASSELWKEWQALGWSTKEKDPNRDTSWKYYDGYYEEDYSWPKDKSNLDKIKQAAVQSKLIHVTGGEPTINPEFFSLLKYCIDKNKSQDIVLDVTTNATKIHPKFFDMASQFKSINLTISMDGVGKTYEYIRYPADYNQVYNNILKYKKFIESLNNQSNLQINFVLQFWNLHNAIETVKTLAPLTINKILNIEPIDDPKFMQWNMLPEQHIKKAVKDLARETDSSKQIKWPLISFSHIIKAYKDLDTSNNSYLQGQLIAFTNQQDSHRQINIQDYIPELADYFK